MTTASVSSSAGFPTIFRTTKEIETVFLESITRSRTSDSRASGSLFPNPTLNGDATSHVEELLVTVIGNSMSIFEIYSVLRPLKRKFKKSKDSTPDHPRYVYNEAYYTHENEHHEPERAKLPQWQVDIFRPILRERILSSNTPIEQVHRLVVDAYDSRGLFNHQVAINPLRLLGIRLKRPETSLSEFNALFTLNSQDLGKTNWTTKIIKYIDLEIQFALTLHLQQSCLHSLHTFIESNPHPTLCNLAEQKLTARLNNPSTNIRDIHDLYRTLKITSHYHRIVDSILRARLTQSSTSILDIHHIFKRNNSLHLDILSLLKKRTSHPQAPLQHIYQAYKSTQNPTLKAHLTAIIDRRIVAEYDNTTAPQFFNTILLADPKEDTAHWHSLYWALFNKLHNPQTPLSQIWITYVFAKQAVEDGRDLQDWVDTAEEILKLELDDGTDKHKTDEDNLEFGVRNGLENKADFEVYERFYGRNVHAKVLKCGRKGCGEVGKRVDVQAVQEEGQNWRYELGTVGGKETIVKVAGLKGDEEWVVVDAATVIEEKEDEEWCFVDADADEEERIPNPEYHGELRKEVKLLDAKEREVLEVETACVGGCGVY